MYHKTYVLEGDRQKNIEVDDMKKRILAILLCVVLLIVIAGCNKSEENKYYNYDLSSYIDLGEYKGLKVTLFSTEATEDEINEYVQNYIENTVFTKAVNKAAAEGDTINIDFVGKIDGVEFDNGSAEDQELVLGQGGYIDGFEDGIVGMKPGETKDVTATFPEDYGSDDLNGKEAVFTITLNAVLEEIDGELTDNFLAAYGTDYTSVAALKEAAKSYIESQKENYEAAYNKDGVISAILETTEIKDYPEAELTRNVESIQESYENYYAQYTTYGMFDGTMIEFINTYTGENYETVEEFYNKYAEDQTRIELILAAVAKDANLSVSDDEVNELSGSYADYSYESEDAFLEAVGGKDYLRWYLLYNKTIDWLVEQTVWLDQDGNEVVYPEPTAEPTEAPSTDAE